MHFTTANGACLIDQTPPTLPYLVNDFFPVLIRAVRDWAHGGIVMIWSTLSHFLVWYYPWYHAVMKTSFSWRLIL